MTLLDTNICVRVLRGDKSVARRLLNADENDDLRMPAMVEGELFYGVEKSERRDENREKVKSLLALIPVCHTSINFICSSVVPTLIPLSKILRHYLLPICKPYHLIHLRK